MCAAETWPPPALPPEHCLWILWGGEVWADCGRTVGGRHLRGAHDRQPLEELLLEVRDELALEAATRGARTRA